MRNCLAITLLLLLVGCSGPQSALDAHGASAGALRDLIILIVVVCAVVWLLVVGFMVWSLVRGTDRQIVQDDSSERKITTIVSVAVTATVLVISALTVASFYTTRALYNSNHATVIVRLKAQQWWWQFIYEYPDGTQIFQTANELHIPVGRDVRVELESIDVIHSFWVPSLAGKLDMIPGRLNILTLNAKNPGIYRGQCAEFCGLQHSHMAFQVIAQDERDFRSWQVTQRQAAVDPSDPEAALGKAAFMSKPCAACHTIRGTVASGTSGPDLTHVGSRATIAAGLLDRTRGTLAAWIADPQTLKPGNNMPLIPLTSDGRSRPIWKP
jgi:cytochrome c oxidase subunit 2